MLHFVRVITPLVTECESVPFVFPFMVIESVLVQLNGVYVLHHMHAMSIYRHNLGIGLDIF